MGGLEVVPRLDTDPVMEAFFTHHKLGWAERTTIKMMWRSYADTEIAKALRASLQTVKNQNSALYRRFGVESRTQLVLLAVGKIQPTIRREYVKTKLQQHSGYADHPAVSALYDNPSADNRGA